MLRIVLGIVALWSGALFAQETALGNGTAVTVPDSAQDSVRTYTLNVPAGMDNLIVILTGGGGDPDLYVNFSEPYLGGDDPSAECISDGIGPEEVCEFESPLPGTWYIEVYGASAYGDGVRLVALASVELQDDVDEPVSGADGSVSWYFIDVPSGQGHLKFATSGGVGNPDMVVGADLFGPVECSSGNAGTADTCEIDQPVAGRWLARISGTDAYTNVTLNAEYGTSRPDGVGTGGGGAPAPGLLGGLLLLALARQRRRLSPPADFDIRRIHPLKKSG